MIFRSELAVILETIKPTNFTRQERAETNEFHMSRKTMHVQSIIVFLDIQLQYEYHELGILNLR